MAYQSPDDFAISASLLPEGVEIKAEDLRNKAQDSMFRSFGDLADLAGAISDPAEQTLLLTAVLKEFTKQTGQCSQRLCLNATDLEIFTHQLKTLNLTGESATKVTEALTVARIATPKPRD